MSWRRAERGDLPLALLWTLTAALGLACVPWLPLAARMAPPCALHTLTGVPCFACGSTRAALALAHGHALEAFSFNPLAAMAMMGGLLGGFVAPGWVALRGPLPGFSTAHERGLRILAWGAVAAQWAYLVLAGR